MVIGLPCLAFWTIRFSYCWLRDHEEGLAVPLRWLIRPAAHHKSIPTLYLSSPPSGCSPDSDSSPLSLSPGREVMARSESTWLGILTPIQVNVPYGPFIQFSKSGEGFMCLFTCKEWEGPKTNMVFERSQKLDINSRESNKICKTHGFSCLVPVKWIYLSLLLYWTKTPVLMWVIWPGNCKFSWKRPKLLKRVNNLGGN